MFAPPQGLIATGFSSSSYPLLFPSGSAGAPTLAPSAAPTFGVYYETTGSAGLRIRLGPGTVALPSINLNTEASPLGIMKSGNGVGILSAAANSSSPGMVVSHLGHGTVQIARDGYYSWHSGLDLASGSPDTFLYRDGAAGIVAQRNSTSAQILRVYNTWTDASNGEWFEANWQVSSNVCRIRTAANGTGSARQIAISYGNTTTSAIAIGSGIASGINMAAGTMSSAGYRVAISPSNSTTATSGATQELNITGTLTDSGTSSTTTASGLLVGPTINYTGATRTGYVQLLRLAPTNTSLPTGNNAAIALSSTASALGGIHYHNQTDEATNYELVREGYVSNVFTIESTKGGSGTLRDIQFILNSETNVVKWVSTATITGAVTDGYVAGLRLTPTYTAATAQTVTRHNYIDINNPTLSGAGPAALTDACVFRFDAAAGTHKAVDAGTTKTTPGGVDAWVQVNINGTLHYMPCYTSKTA